MYGDMWHGVGACGRVWGHVAGCGGIGGDRVWGHVARGGGYVIWGQAYDMDRDMLQG